MKYKKIITILLTLAVTLGGCGYVEEDAFFRGMSAVATQDYNTAQMELTQALAAGKEDQELVCRGLGLCYMGQGEYTKALSAFYSALKEAGIDPGDTEKDINYYMAICYYKLGQYDEAIERYDAITGMMPKETEAYFLRGNMKLYLNDVEGAVGDFDKAAELKKKDYRMCLDIYDCMMQHGQEAQAQKYLDAVLKADAKDISDYDKGRLCYYSREYAQACNYLERVRSSDAADATIIKLLGECYKLQGQYEYAAVVYNGYADQHADAQICNELGLCYAEQGEYEEALQAFRKGLEIKENNTCTQTLKRNEIISCEHLGDYEKALELLKAYIDIYGSDEGLEREYAFLITR